MKKSILVITAVMTLLFTLSGCKRENKEPEKVYYNVVFESNGGSTVETQKVEKGQPAVKPADPTKEGTGAIYFGAWYTDQKLTEEFDFATPIEKDTVLYASWLTVPAGSFLVMFDTDCDQEVPNQIVKNGEAAKQPEQSLTKEGYAFSYWYSTDEAVEFNFATTPITQNTTLYAKWNHSGIYRAAFNEEAIFSINVYDSFEPDAQSGAW